MGCLCSRGAPEPVNPRTFKVINVDDHGQERNPGHIEITESELIWFQRGKEAIRWPLKSLRRYGFDAELFSFESGRRCPTGPGIYAFKCRRAEALFNLLQESIQRQRSGQDDTGFSSSSPVVGPNNIGQTLVHPVQTNSLGATTGRASRPVSGEMPPNGTPPLYINGDVNGHQYMNTEVNQQGTRKNSVVDTAGVTVIVPPAPRVPGEHVIQYAELDLPKCGEDGTSTNDSSPNHVPNGHKPNSSLLLQPSSQQVMYVNVPASEIKTKTASLGPVSGKAKPLEPRNGLKRQYSAGDDPRSSGAVRKQKVNYIQLELDDADSHSLSSRHSPASPTSLMSNPDSPTRQTDTYARIDIQRTLALNNPPPNHTDDDGTRKTRHNSNIDDLH